MIRDRGPRYTYGYGLTSDDLPQRRGETDSHDPEGGLLSKSLHDHPVMRFFLMAGTTMVSMHVAGKVVRDGGVKLGAKWGSKLAQEEASGVARTWQTKLLKSVRDVSSTFDDWEKTVFDGKDVHRRGFFFHADEDPNGPAGWSWKDEVKDRMFRQARRLPYELPAAYVAQRMVVDPLYGQTPKERKVKWYNPVDVLGDFAQQSFKNLTTMILPFEAGNAVATQGYRRFMALGDPNVNLVSGWKRTAQKSSVSLQQILEEVGFDASTLLHSASKYSQASTGAFATALHEATNRSKNIVQHLHETRGSGKSYTDRAKAAIKDPELLDVSIGPFGGMGSFVKTFNEEFRLNVQAANARDSILNGARVGEFGVNLRSRFKGHTPAERLGAAVYDLGRKGPDHGSFRYSQFFRGEMASAYKLDLERDLKDRYIAQLVAKGSTPMEAALEADSVGDAVRQLQVRGAENLRFRKRGQRFDVARRISMGSEPIGKSFTGDPEGYISELTRRLDGAGIKDAESIARMLPDSVRATDAAFQHTIPTVETAIKGKYAQLYKEAIVPYASRRLGTGKIPWTALDMDPSSAGADTLLRELAQSIGYDTRTAAPDAIRGYLKGKGFDLRDLREVRGALAHQKVVSAPWHKDGFNLFGMRKLTLEEALKRNYFSHLPKTVRDRVESLSGDIMERSPDILSLGRTNVGPGVWVNKSGQVVDFSHLVAGGRKFMDLTSDLLQVPLVHIPPLNVLGYSARRSYREGPMIRYSSGMSRASFLGDKTSSHVWMQERGLKGSVARIGEKITTLNGSYLAAKPDQYSLVGRQMRLAIRDRGDYLRGGTDNRNRLQRMMGLDRDQSESFSSWFKRWRQKSSGSIDNVYDPAVLARKLTEPGWFEGLAKEEQETVARAWSRSFRPHINRYGFSPRIRSRLMEGLSTVRGSPVSNLYGKFGATDDVARVLERGSSSEVMSVARQVLQEDLHGLSPDRERIVRIAQQRLDRLLKEQWTKDPDLLGSAASRKAGVFRRIDEFKLDFERYLLLRPQLLNSKNPTTIVEELMSALQATETRLTPAEVRQARAAILALQVEYQSVMQAARGGDHATQLMRTLREMSNNTDMTTGARRVMPKHIESLFGSIGNYEERLGDFGNTTSAFRQFMFRKFYTPKVPEESYNPFGGNTDWVIHKTFGTAFKEKPLRAVGSALGINTWSDPESFSGMSMPVSHFFTRLNRYFESLGGKVNETAYAGPLDFYARGMMGRVVMPTVAVGSTALAVDAMAGGAVRGKDDNGKRQYTPLVGGIVAGGIARTQMALAGIIPGGQTYSEKRDELLHGDVAIRRGRWWPLGSSPWEGGRIMYHRPSWYRRFMSGWQYTGQLWDSPMERLAYGYDWSPGRWIPGLNNHWERKHAKDRPYPVTGEMFTGPWGPLTGFLNATVGRVLKPQKLMHEKEMEAAMAGYQPTGMYAATAPSVASPADYANTYLKLKGRPTVAMATTAGAVLSDGVSRGQVLSLATSGGQPMSTMTGDVGYSTGSPYITGRQTTRTRHLVNRSVVPSGPEFGAEPAGSTESGQVASAVMVAPGASRHGKQVSQETLALINQHYAQAAENRPVIKHKDFSNMPVFLKGTSMRQRVIPNMPTVSQRDFGVQSGQFGYELQELFGIYGFLFGSAREAMGLGSQDLSPKRPMLLAASRAYGSERAFWDLNLGGLGDTPLPLEGEYANLEFSEIIRRFVPHRRRDINEINPIPNQMGKEHSWLPSSDYFINFHTGDPYASIAEGEIRLPGAAYERLNKLHPDKSGKYGIVDKMKILGNVAPWSREYEVLASALPRMRLTEEERDIVRTTKKQVSAINKRVSFSPYKYSYQDFQQKRVKITGRVPGSADKFFTDEFKQPIRIAGVRARSEAAQAYMDKLVRPGSHVKITYNANQGPSSIGTIDAIIEKRGKNLGDALLEKELGYKSSTETALEAYMRDGKTKYKIKGYFEQLSHRNTFLNAKFLRNRTAVEDWERQNVYGATFPQWQHPFRDFMMPMIYKAMGRNPLTSAVSLSIVGSMFAKGKYGKTVGGFIGGIVGATSSAVFNLDKFGFNERFMPIRRKKEVAIEEYTDILKYVKYTGLYAQSRAVAKEREGVDPEQIAQMVSNSEDRPIVAVGPITQKALQYRKEIQRTMYGADPFGDVMDLYAAMPKRKRDHFMEFLKAPKNERGRILSTAGRLERRIYEARWGMKVEKRPELESYFQNHELPDQNWEGWLPEVDMEQVKLKIIQNQGLDASQMGYYPQQVKEANLMNPSYPNMYQPASHQQVANQLRSMFANSSIGGDVYAMPSHMPGTHVQFNMGVAA